MAVRLDEVPAEIRETTVAALRQRRSKLVRDLVNGLSTETGFEGINLPDFAGILLTILSATIKSGWVDARTAAIQELGRVAPPLNVRQLIRAINHAERTVIGELSLEESIGANPESWQMASRSISTAAVEITAVVAESHAATNALRDQLTTLLSPSLFDFVLGKEIVRALRHKHGLAVMLFDLDDLSTLNRTHGRGAGDWLLERLGILARQFFRTHDSAARYGGDSIAVMLPETPFDQAAALANQFRQMVCQRLVLIEDQTQQATSVTLSAAAVGTDLVNGELDARTVMAEAEAAVVRAQMNGGNRLERVGLLPTSVTIPGAATLLGLTARDVVRLVRSGDLKASRRGRHRHIERDALDEYRRRG
jgi:diguanylate cyclase (GGDEF)-like protein/excisionase family DNA binding protein